ncbi:hypothetical protein [Acetobacterium malicum]|uniref:hypothetical protein n=1 Tax=Acetobacterium malicum TaxID=52692 RepID=UPI0035948F94
MNKNLTPAVKCVKCKKRIGNLCKELDQRLVLISVEKELEFDKPKECKEEVKHER